MKASYRWPAAFAAMVLLAAPIGAQIRGPQDRNSQALKEAIGRATQPADLAELILTTKERALGEPFDAAIRAALKSRMETLPPEQLAALAKQGEFADIPAALGSVTTDLVYTPVIPCRVFDSRPSAGGPGPIPANTQRNVVVAGTLGFPAQGGAAGGCGVPVGATSVIINFVTVLPAGPGNIRAWAVASPQPPAPLAAIMNYGTVTGLPAIANGVAVPLCNPAATDCSLGDLRLQADTSATNILGDVVGYFGPATGIVTSVNSITGPVTIAAGANISVTPSGSTVTVAYAPPTCSAGQVLQYNGSSWICATVGVQTGCSAIDILPCYSGPAGTLGVGTCKAGYRLCNAISQTFGACGGEVLPASEIVGDSLDTACDGPTVVSTAPANLATSVPANVAISVTFADFVDAATITASSFTLSGPGGVVAGTISQSGPRTFTLTPGSPLAQAALYTVMITSAVKDPAGAAMPAPYTFTFTTSAGPGVAITPPVGIKHTTVYIEYTLSDAGSNPASIVPEYSVDGGVNWAVATRSGTLGEATTGLATSPVGTHHVFAWFSASDGVGVAGVVNTVRFRITATALATGTPTSTANFSVDNNLQQAIGQTTGFFPRGGTVCPGERCNETALGDLVAEASRLAAGTQLFVTNGGGLRSVLPSAFAVTNPALVRTGCAPLTPCDLVMGDAYTELPFGNYIVTRTITGAELWAVLERSVSQAGTVPTAYGGFLQIAGFTFSYKPGNGAFSRVQSVKLNGVTDILQDATVYTLATNDFTAGGGDGYVEFVAGPWTPTYKVMSDVLFDYIKSQITITPTIAGRIIALP